MTTAFRLDLREFDQAMIQYAAASGKDLADISNFKLQDACIKSIAHAPKAKMSDIQKLAGEEPLVWWLAHKLRRDKQAGGRYDNYYRAKELLLNRIKSVYFVKGFFSLMSFMLAPFTGKFAGGNNIGGKKRYKGMAGLTPSVKPATPGQLNADVGVIFNAKYTDAQAKKLESILYSALQQGLSAAVADMMVYVDRKMGITAKKHSARGA